MHSSGSFHRRVAIAAFAVSLSVCALDAASARAGQAEARRDRADAGAGRDGVLAAPPQTAKQRFDAASESGEKVRLLLTNMKDATPVAELIKQVSQVTTAFEILVRRFPTSGYADDALWQAGSLADTAYQRFKRPEDLDRATKLYRWLVKEYPTSPMIKQANARLAAFAKLAPAVSPATALLPAVATTSAPPVSVPASAPAAAPAAPPTDAATLTGIQRAVLTDAVRITLELDREVSYHEERIGGPARLFFDLKNVQTTAALKDKVLSFPSDVVSKIRVGRHPDNTVRVVLDFENVAKYSVFTLYNPFRLVIDAERASSTPRAMTTAPLLAATAPTELPKAVVSEQPVAPPMVTDAPLSSVAAAPPGTAAASVATSPSAPAANVAGGFSIARQLGLSVSRIVIDPGHGGHDPGTMAKGLNEAALTLDVALRLEKLLQKDPGVEVVLTRRTDVYVPLEERTAIANRANADLFLSVHANSSKNEEARGIETYFLSFASSPDAEAVAARENTASEREMHQLPDIIKAIALNNKLDESRDLANMVQNQLVTTLKKSNKDVRSRGVKKAPFVVLIGAAMPSVLAEISFLTNKQELQLLKTGAYKDKIAQSLYNAVVQYRRSLKGSSAVTLER